MDLHLSKEVFQVSESLGIMQILLPNKTSSSNTLALLGS